MRLFLLFVAFLFATIPALAGERTVQRLTSPAGHEFLFLEMPEARKVSVEILWPSDWAFDADRNPAVPTLGVNLLAAGGAGELDAAGMAEALADTGSRGSLRAGAEGVRGTMLVSPENVEEAGKLANLMLTAPRLEERWLARIRDRVKADLELTGQKSSTLAEKALGNAILGDDPLNGFINIEDTAVIDGVSGAEIRRWVRRTFVTDGISAAIAGRISAAQAGRALDLLLAGLPEGEAPRPRRVEADFSPRTIVLHRPEAEKTVLAFAGRLPPTSQGGEWEDALAMQILGAGEQSRLFKAIRTDLRAAYGFFAYSDTYTRDIRYLGLAGEVEGRHLAQARALVRETYRDFLEKGPNEDEVEALKASMGAELRKDLDLPGVVTASLIEADLDGTDPQRVPRLLDELEAVTAGSVRERLRAAYPAADDLVEIIVTPDADAVEGACVVKSAAEVRRCR